VLKPEAFLGLVVASAMTLSGGESRSDGSSDGGDHNNTAGGIDSSVFAAHTGQRGFPSMQTNTEAETKLGNMGMIPAALAYDPNGDVVYVCDGDSLYSVNEATGATTFVGTYFQNEQCNPIFGSGPAIR
jgi:hypothetical protein